MEAELGAEVADGSTEDASGIHRIIERSAEAESSRRGAWSLIERGAQ